MRRFLSLGVLLAVIIGLGVLLSVIGQSGTLPGVRPQTTNPNASALVMTPEQGVWLLIWTFFLVIGPIATFAAFLTFIMWWGNRQVVRAKSEDRQRSNSRSIRLSRARWAMCWCAVRVW